MDRCGGSLAAGGEVGVESAAMKVTAQSRYALRILLDVALYGGAEPRSIREIAASQAISEKFISRIVVPLRRAGLLESIRGGRGGLRLARMPDRITMLDVVQAIDGPVSLLACLTKPHVCPKQGRCAAADAWSRVNEGFVETLRSIRLSDVVERHRRRTLGDPDGPEYSI